MPLQDRRCAECGITEETHLELYGTPLGIMNFTLQPDHGPAVSGRLYLCRPCTHEVMSRRMLVSAGVPEEALTGDIWT